MPQKACGVAAATLIPSQQPNNVTVLPIFDPPNIVAPPPAWAGPAATSDLRFDSPQTLYWLASLARATYAPGADFFHQVARAVVPSTAQITFTVNGPGLTPGWGSIVLPDALVVVVSGTTNLHQWLSQIFLNGLTECNHRLPPLEDNARAMALYNTAADTIAAALPAGGAEKPTICVGHSMGGAVAQVLWRRRRLRGAPGGRCLTFGSPKPGTTELHIGAGGDWRFNLRIIQAADPVPSLPPDLGLAALVVPLAMRPFTATWDDYHQFGALRLVNGQGGLDESNEPGALSIIPALIAGAAAGNVDPGAAHVMRSYCEALRLGFTDYNTAECRRWASPAVLDTAANQMTAAGL